MLVITAGAAGVIAANFSPCCSQLSFTLKHRLRDFGVYPGLFDLFTSRGVFVTGSCSSTARPSVEVTGRLPPSLRVSCPCWSRSLSKLSIRRLRGGSLTHYLLQTLSLLEVAAAFKITLRILDFSAWVGPVSLRRRFSVLWMLTCRHVDRQHGDGNSCSSK